jgi:tRNA isopentenyl-2-thiomethyl-A-37 hydroxylase MiaE
MPLIVEASDRFGLLVPHLPQELAKFSDAGLVVIGIDRFHRYRPALLGVTFRAT